MKSKKCISSILAALICMTSFTFPMADAAFSHSIKLDSSLKADSAIFSSDFEGSSDSWSARGTSTLSNDSESYYTGKSSLKVSKRGDYWCGASIDLNTTQFTAGSTYSFSAAVLQNSGSSLDMKMTLQYSINGMANYSQIDLQPVSSGVWTKLENLTYTIPSGATGLQLYIEIPDSLSDFYIDTVLAAPQGTPSSVVTGKGVVNGKGSDIKIPDEPAENIIRGDIDNDGVITSFDMILARKAVINTFAGVTASKAADIDGNGAVEVNDLVLLMKFLLGESSSFPVVTTTTTTTTAPKITTTTTVTNNPSGKDLMDQLRNDIYETEASGSTSKRSNVDYGKIEKVTYFSKDANKNKSMNVLLPPGYSKSEKYPVLYILHGIFGDENSMIDDGMKVQTILGNLIADGKAEKMIVVFPAMFTTNTGTQPGFTDASNEAYDHIREDIENSIMPYMEQNYSIKTGRDNTAVTGFSMGGREALYIGITRPKLYGYVGAACPAPGVTPAQDNYMRHLGSISESEMRYNAGDPTPYVFLISAAVNDGVVGTFPEQYHNLLAKNGVDHVFQKIGAGDHGGNTVRPHLYNFLRYVFKAN